MTISQFDTEKGLYAFTENNLVTQMHSHPALEILMAKEGSFSLSTPHQNLEHLRMAVVQPNQRHAFNGPACSCDFIFTEPGMDFWSQLSKKVGPGYLHDGIILLPDDQKDWMMQEIIRHEAESWKEKIDDRVWQCIESIKANIRDSALSLPLLAGVVHLSPGRLSHLFKAQMGVTVQRYIIWTRMKMTIDAVLQRDLDLAEAAYAAGFYDPAHFTRHFREIFGVKPSAVYNNSRIVQM